MHITRRRLLKLGAALFTGAAGTATYAWLVEPHWIEIVQRDLPIAHLPKELEGETLVQLSDIHVGPHVADEFLKHAFQLVEAMEPGLIVVTGDYVTSPEFEEVDHGLRVMQHLPKGRLATIGILGNHDYGNLGVAHKVADKLSRGLREQGLDVLRNERRTVAGLTIVGMDDYWGPYFSPRRALAGLPGDAASLVLCHNPDGVDQPGWDGYQGWILAGHTHGGQVKVPFLPVPRVPVKNRRYVAGEVDLRDGRRLYINRALGHLLQARLNVRPEITVFRLTRAEASLG